MNTPKSRLPALLGGLLSVSLAATAYLVYTNVLAGLPVSVSFFWFSLFAAIASLFYPQASRADAIEVSSSSRRLSPFVRFWWTLYRPSFEFWRGSLSRGGLRLLFLSALCYCLHFGFLLSALRRTDQKGVVTTVLIVLQLSSIASVVIGRLVAKDTCENWRAYAGGAVLTFAGVLFYIIGTREYGTLVLDKIVLLGALAAIFVSISVSVRQKYLRQKKYKANPVSTMQGVNAGAALLAVIWVVFDPLPFTLPTPEQYWALFYLGVVPTAISGIISAKIMHRKAIASMESLSSFRPLFTTILGAIAPFSWFRQDPPPITFSAVSGFVLIVVGVVIIWEFAKPGHLETPSSG